MCILFINRLRGWKRIVKGRAMILKVMSLGSLQANGYILGCEKTKEAVIMDPGGDAEVIVETLDMEGLVPLMVLNTHAHFDHIGGNRDLVERYHIPIGIHSLELPLMKAKGGAAFFGLDIPESPEPERLIEDGEVLSFGEYEIKALFTPGHSPGHLCFYVPLEKILFSGDLLFAGGIGRADLPGGNMEVLAQSIVSRLYILPDDTMVCPGHGPQTTIGDEKKYNPFVRE